MNKSNLMKVFFKIIPFSIVTVPLLLSTSCSSIDNNNNNKILDEAFAEFDENNININYVNKLNEKVIETKLPFLINNKEMVNSFFTLKNPIIIKNDINGNPINIFINLDSVFLNGQNQLTIKLIYSTTIQKDKEIFKMFDYTIENTEITTNILNDQAIISFSLNKESYKFEDIPLPVWDLYIETYQNLYFGEEKLKSDLIIDWKKLTTNTSFEEAKSSNIISKAWEFEINKNTYIYNIDSSDFDEYNPTKEIVNIKMNPKKMNDDFTIRNILQEDKKNNKINPLENILFFQYKLIPNIKFGFPTEATIKAHITKNGEIAGRIDTSSKIFNPTWIDPLIFEKTTQEIIEQQNKYKNVFYAPKKLSKKIENREISFEIEKVEAVQGTNLINVTLKIIVGTGKFKSTEKTYTKFFDNTLNKFL
ncbi:MAG: hypothetical protein ACRDA7_02585 [Metamycoplasmataceae bacterium]